MDLEHLPQFHIIAITDQAQVPRLAGHFTHLAGVRKGRSWLYDPEDPLIGNLTNLDSRTQEAIFLAPLWTSACPAQIGRSLPWVDGYWEPAQLTMILDRANEWCRTVFEPTDAQHFRLHGATGWQRVGCELPAGAVPTRVIPGGWDHEHCTLCQAKIGVGGAEIGYADSSDNWLCEDCYRRYGEPRDLGFLTSF